MEEIIKKGIYNIRIDTHPDNIPMKNFIAKAGFIYRGEIEMADGSPRLAYDMLISNNQ